MKKLMYLLLTSIFLIALSSNSYSSEFDDDLLKIQQEWAHINYQVTGDKQKKALLLLIENAQSFQATYKNKAEALIWTGIVNSTHAGTRGGLVSMAQGLGPLIGLLLLCMSLLY